VFAVGSLIGLFSSRPRTRIPTTKRKQNRCQLVKTTTVSSTTYSKPMLTSQLSMTSTGYEFSKSFRERGKNLCYCHDRFCKQSQVSEVWSVIEVRLKQSILAVWFRCQINQLPVVDCDKLPLNLNFIRIMLSLPNYLYVLLQRSPDKAERSQVVVRVCMYIKKWSGLARKFNSHLTVVLGNTFWIKKIIPEGHHRDLKMTVKPKSPKILD
jgi:hypothetical protein